MELTCALYDVVQVDLEGTAAGNPYEDVWLVGRFTHVASGECLEVTGFYRGEGRYAVRCMPTRQGAWEFAIRSNDPAMDGQRGTVECGPARPGAHGRVQVDPRDRFRFRYEDGTRFEPYGTTCYAWINQDGATQEETLRTLQAAPFNKIRMCIFPKWYDFNKADPERYAFQGSPAAGFDHRRFDEAFFANLDRRVTQLADLGIEADLILFHPYDKPEWGFSRMSPADDEFYLNYVVARYAAFRNIWWSFANEYDLMDAKTDEDWRRLARVVMGRDSWGHLRSIHHCVRPFDHNEPWVTHCSMQRIDVTRTAECVTEWRAAYGKPVIVDETGYEGDIQWGWGNLTPQEETRRFWEGVLRGGYVSHGEVYVEQPRIWWAHGGSLVGQSPERIAFLRAIMAEAPADWRPARGTGFDRPEWWDVTVATTGEDWSLVYFGFNAPLWREFKLPTGVDYDIDVIDTWNMTVERVPGPCRGTVRVDLDRRQYMAVRLRRR